MHPRFKHFLKKYLLYYKLKKRFSHAENARQQTLFEHFKANKGTIDFNSVGFKSKLVLYIFSNMFKVEPL